MVHFCRGVETIEKIKLMSHTLKLQKRVVKSRLRSEVSICGQQYGFMSMKKTTDAKFVFTDASG